MRLKKIKTVVRVTSTNANKLRNVRVALHCNSASLTRQLFQAT